MVSTVTFNAGLVEVLPAPSVNVYVNACVPSPKGDVGVNVPATESYVAATEVPSTYNLGVSVKLAPMFTPGVVSSVVGAVLVDPVTVPTSSL